jgi:hypothetical protein
MDGVILSDSMIVGDLPQARLRLRCSDLITSAARLDYSATLGWDSVRIAMPSGCHYGPGVANSRK